MFDTPAYKELFETQEETQHPWSRGMTEDQVRRRAFPGHAKEEQLIVTTAGGPGVLQIVLDRAVSQWRRASPVRKGTEIDHSRQGENLARRRGSYSQSKLRLTLQNGVFEYKYNTDVVVCRTKV